MTDKLQSIANPPALVLANLIQRCANAHEESYDKIAAIAAGDAAKRKAQEDPTDLYAGLVDFYQFYRLTKREACIQECNAAGQPQLAEPIFLMIELAWNDAIDWATTIQEQHSQDKEPA